MNEMDAFSQDSGVPRVDVLRASVPDIRAFASLLRGIYFNSTNQRATLTINDTGLMVSVEEARTLIASAYIARDIFDEYEYNGEDAVTATSQDSGDGDRVTRVVLSLKLFTLLECLNIFGTAHGPSTQTVRHVWKRNEDASDGEESGLTTGQRNQRRNNAGANGRIDNFFAKADGKGTGMRLTYTGPGYPLKLILAEDAKGPTTTCELVTYEAEQQIDFRVDSSNIKLLCILKSTWLRDALSELDPSCDKLTFIGNPTVRGTQERGSSPPPKLRIQANGTLGSSEMDYPNDPDVLEVFQCEQTVSFSYRFAHIAKTLKALQSSLRTSLRIDGDGILSLQFLSSSPSPRGGSVDSILDFKCLSIDDRA